MVVPCCYPSLVDVSAVRGGRCRSGTCVPAQVRRRRRRSRRDASPSFRSTFAWWNLTVRVAMPSAAPIPSKDSPAMRRSRTALSRTERPARSASRSILAPSRSPSARSLMLHTWSRTRSGATATRPDPVEAAALRFLVADELLHDGAARPEPGDRTAGARGLCPANGTEAEIPLPPEEAPPGLLETRHREGAPRCCGNFVLQLGEERRHLSGHRDVADDREHQAILAPADGRELERQRNRAGALDGDPARIRGDAAAEHAREAPAELARFFLPDPSAGEGLAGDSRA